MSSLGTIAIIGGGVASLSAARTLAAHGSSVTVFDKGRRPAGRISTRHAGEHDFDHGAQYATARGATFRSWVHAAANEGVVAPWTGRLVRIAADGSVRAVEDDETRWVGVPGMNAIATHMARELDVKSPVRIARMERARDAWTLLTTEGEHHGPFDAVVVAIPAGQAAELLPEDTPLRAEAARFEMGPTWAVMLGLSEPYGVELDGAFVEGGALSWIARNSSKPGRPPGESWVLHATPEWTDAHFEDDLDANARALVRELERTTGRAIPEPTMMQSFRWKFARALRDGTPEGYLMDAERRLVVCGDWCVGLRVEGAWNSGLWAAEAMLTL